MDIKRIQTGQWRENCYIVSNVNKQSIIIDPGSNSQKIDNYIEKYKLSICAIINTHGHYDHVGAIKFLKDKYSIPFFLHSKDLKLMKSANFYVSLFEGNGLIEIPSVDYYLDDLKLPHQINDFSINIIPTPGHTLGSVLILIEDCLFTGDTLFKNKFGRVDLPGGDEVALKKSLGLIAKIKNNYKIFPGHGEPTTIKNELKNIKLYLQL